MTGSLEKLTLIQQLLVAKPHFQVVLSENVQRQLGSRKDSDESRVRCNEKDDMAVILRKQARCCWHIF